MTPQQDQTPRLTGIHRVVSAVRRRLRRGWRLLGLRQTAGAEEAALDWLLAADTGQGLWADSRQSSGCPGITGASIETALAYGCRQEAIRWARWLMAILPPEGAAPNGLCGVHFSHHCMAQAARGLLAILPDLPEAEPAARRACKHVCSSIDVGAEIDVLPFLEAGLRWPETGWRFEAQLAVERQDAAPIYPSLFVDFTRRIETQIAVGRTWRARDLLEEIAPHQRRDGSCFVPDGFLHTARLAQLACVWYKLDERERADRAVAYVQRKQRADGGFPAVLDRWPPRLLRLPDTWAAKFYLDAALLRVCAAFDARWREFPETIDAKDGRAEAARNWMAALPPSAHVADVGCGKGRFLRHLLGEFPSAKFTGIDISAAMLSMLPPCVAARNGSILRTGAAEGEFDGAMAVETLEHSLVPRRAIAELCRIVRPGGRLLVIDKDRRKQPLSEHDPWERWVTAGELQSWLAPYCCDIQVRHVSHQEGRPGTDLFLAATAICSRRVNQ